MVTITARVDAAPFEPVLAPVQDLRPAALGSRRARSVWLLTTDAAAALAVLAVIQVAAGAQGLAAAVLAAVLWCALLRAETGVTVTRAGIRFGLVAWSVSALGLVGTPSGLLLLTTVALTLTGSAARLATTSALDRLAPALASTRVLAIGSPAQLHRVGDELARDPGLDLVGLCQVADLESLEHAVATTGAEAVLVLPSDELDERGLQRIGWQLEKLGTTLYVGCGLLDVAGGRTSLVRLAGLNAVRVQPARRRGAAVLLKSVAERTLATAALVVLAPLFLALAVLIRLDSPGPAFFRQVRVGRDGQPFSMLKLRTMLRDAEARKAALVPDDTDGVLFKLRVDPRVTRVGRWLRKFSLDELPQLVNIARGEMSLVGPRPALPAEVEAYDDDPRRRLVVKPGLTGLWQVSGRSDLSWDESVRLDLTYVDNWSLGLDVRIVARTAAAVLRHRGAY